MHYYLTVNCVGVSPTGHYFATGSQQDYKTRIWRVETKESPLRLTKKDFTHKYKFRSSDRESVVVTLITELFGVMKGIWDIAFSNLGDRLLTRLYTSHVYTFRADEDGYKSYIHNTFFLLIIYTKEYNFSFLLVLFF